MKRIKHLSLGLLVSLFVAIGVASAASAVWSPNFKTSDDIVTLAKEDEHDGSLYATGNQVTIDGTVKGSLYCAGGVVTINGTVEGDVLCAGQKLTVNGRVGQDIRAAGQFIEVNGIVGGSVTAFGQDVRLGDESRIAGDVNGGAQQFTISGTVGRDVAVGTQLLSVSGEIEGNVDVAVEQLQLADQASIAGNFNYASQNELSFDESKVGGVVSYNPAQRGGPQHYNGVNIARLLAAAKLLFLIMLAVSALAVALVMPRFVNRSSEIFSRQMSLVALIGFATVFGGPILVGLLLFSIVLAPIGLALLFAWLVVILLSGIFFAYWVGSKLLGDQQNIIVRMLGGIIIVLILYIVPFINGLVMFAALVLGSGMIVTTLTSGYKRPNYQVSTRKVSAKKAAS